MIALLLCIRILVSCRKIVVLYAQSFGLQDNNELNFLAVVIINLSIAIIIIINIKKLK